MALFSGLLRPTDIAILLFSLYVLSRIIQNYKKTKTTPLQGPPSPSVVFGHSRIITRSQDTTDVLEQWMEGYGSCYSLFRAGWGKRVIINDPKTIASFYSKDTFAYQQTATWRKFLGKVFGNGLVVSEAESHKRQRKALSPAFSNVAIRRLTPVFFDSAHKLKSAWDQIILSTTNESPIIDVQIWMNRAALDSVGIAGFSHDFKGLTDLNNPSAVAVALDSFGTSAPSVFFGLSFILGAFFPPLAGLTNLTDRGKMLMNLGKTMDVIAGELLEREKRGSDNVEDKSVIGLLIKASNAEPNQSLHITQEEVLAQMNALLLAGYETTSISLTWALIELCRHPGTQTRLRSELVEYGADPTWDQFTNELPYLDAVVHETLRLHPPLELTTRVAMEDDVLPLTTSLITATGESVNELFIAKGTMVSAPIAMTNQSTVLWGEDAKEYKPERWLVDDGGKLRKNEISGHRHLLTFVDGPRTCLGKGFALAEFKAVLSVLIRSYTFEFPDVNTSIERHESILPRPKVAGQLGAKVPLRVKKVE